MQTDLVVPYTPAQLRHWLREGTAAGVGAAGVEEGAGDDDAAGAMRRHGARTARRLRVDVNGPLREVMAAPGHVVPSTLVLFVVARGSAAKERFLSGKW